MRKIPLNMRDGAGSLSPTLVGVLVCCFIASLVWTSFFVYVAAFGVSWAPKPESKSKSLPDVSAAPTLPLRSKTTRGRGKVLEEDDWLRKVRYELVLAL